MNAGVLRAADLTSAWNANRWASIYVFAGEEEFLMEESARRFTDHWLGKSYDPMQIETLDADELDPEVLLQQAQSLPLLASKRLVKIRHAESLNVANQRELAELMNQPTDDSAFLIYWEKAWKKDDAEKPLLKAIQAKAPIVVFWRLFPEQAQTWLIQDAQSHGFILESDAARWMVEELGASLRLLSSEIIKLELFVLPRKTITLADAQAASGYRQEASVFTWLDTVRAQRPVEAARLLNRLLNSGEEPIMMIALLQRAITQWVQAKEHGAPGGFGAWGKANEQLEADAKRWDSAVLKRALHQLVEIDAAIKSGKENAEVGLTRSALPLSFGKC